VINWVERLDRAKPISQSARARSPPEASITEIMAMISTT